MKIFTKETVLRKILIAGLLFAVASPTLSAKLASADETVPDKANIDKVSADKVGADKTLLKKPMTRELKGVQMPEEMMLNTKKLVLNGMGLREVQILALYIKVYVAGLYLEKKSSNGEEIINSATAKVVDLHFLRHVSVGDFYESLEKGLANNCVKETCDEAKSKWKEFKANLKPINEGDTLEFVFDAHSVAVSLKGEKLGAIDDVPFVKGLLAVWVGPKPVTDELKHGMLGADR